MSKPHGAVARSTLKLRDRYFETWNREWPHDDDYMRTLWTESQDKNEKGNSRIPAADVYANCLMRMRENHEFQPDAANIDGATPGASSVLADEFN